MTTRPPRVPEGLTQEPLDVLLFRPIAALVVRALVRTAVTPNQLSLSSGLLGCGAAVLLAFDPLGTRYWFTALLIASITLDCADGQLARARGTRSYAGWVMDVLCDSSKGLAIGLGGAIALLALHGLPGLALGVASGLSVSAQILVRDRMLHDFDRDAGVVTETDQARRARIEDERARLYAGPLTLGALALRCEDLAKALRRGLGGSSPSDPGPRTPLDDAPLERRIAAQTLWRHLGGTAQLVISAVAVGTGRLVAGSVILVVIGNALFAVAVVAEWRARVPAAGTAAVREKSSG